METNPQIELAERYVTDTGVSVFLTGKAGTGKTTFLHHIVGCCRKRSVVLAPTGVAAVNAGGVTIHSFFQLPFCPYLPDVPELVTEYQMPESKRQLRKSKLDIIRTLDLLIIDEISMVRADLLDAVDDVLRRIRRNQRPFGGLQLLLIGDVQQLAPVVTDDERPYMERVYPSPFFFHSKALQRLPYITVQLTTIYRQQDDRFVRLLNNIRDSRFDPDTLAALNARVQPRASQPGSQTQDPILLTTHNYQADRVNQQRLAALPGREESFAASVSGSFPELSAPADMRLVLKEGAQVMFVKNDGSGARRYYNGKIGTVERFAANDDGDRTIEVRDEAGTLISVSPERWENLKYELDPADNQIKQHVDGTFTQYPLRTAWAITIHKAQGLTFDRVQVDAAAAFAYGQVYVALSRCRSLEGLTLLSPITPQCAFSSSDIEQFNRSLTPEAEAQARLEACRKEYYYGQLFDLFDLSALQHDADRLDRLFQDHLRSTYPKQAALLASITGADIAGLVSVADRFRRQLTSISQLPDGQAAPQLADRVGKAAGYFAPQLDGIHRQLLPLLALDIDNRETEKQYAACVEHLRASLGLKQALLKQVVEEGFTLAAYQKAKVDFILQKPKKAEMRFAGCENPALAQLLTDWRRAAAREQNVPAHTILTQKSLLAIADQLPRSGKALLKIPGLGPARVARYGIDLLQIIDDYCDEKDFFQNNSKF